MPRPAMRDNAIDALGGTHVYKTGASSVTAATVVAAPSTGIAIRVKAYRFVARSNTATDIALNDAWLSDGASTPLLALLSTSILDVTAGSINIPMWDTGLLTLPGFGVKCTAATALTIDFTATDSGNLVYQLDVFYDLVNATGDVQ